MKKTLINYFSSPEVIGSKIPIICSQETFILRENSYNLTQALPGFQLVINPAVKNSHDRGRPRNGMYIAYPANIRNIVTDVSPGYWRLQAVVLNFESTSTLLINSYFPTDPRAPNADQSELLEVLSNIRDIIRKNEFDSIMWAGDINADFIRNTAHTSVVKDFIEELGLTCSWERFPIDFTCCHDILGVSHVSTLDHFFWSPQLDEYVTDAGVLHLTDNKSDHSPIFCAVRYPLVAMGYSKANQRQPKPSWCRAKVEEKERYKALLNDRISMLEVPESLSACRDVHCHDPAHIRELDNFTMDLLENIQDVAEQSLPVPGSGLHGGSESSSRYLSLVE